MNLPALRRVVLQASSDLHQWINIKTNLINDPGILTVKDLGDFDAAARFYRINPAE
jgi:hypothetical protein